MADIRAQITRVRDAANDIAENAGDRIKGGTDKARESAGELRERASDAYTGARDTTQRAATRANEILQEHPIAAVAGAVAAGALVAWLFPKSRAAMKALPGLATTAGARVVEAALAARAAAGEGAEALRANAGGAIETVRDSATHAATSARNGAAKAASSALDSAQAADLGGKASKLADDVIAIVADKVDALGEALKARLPKR